MQPNWGSNRPQMNQNNQHNQGQAFLDFNKIP